MNDSTGMLSTGQVAALLGVSRDSVVRHIACGNLPAIDVGTGSRRRYRIAPEAVEAFKRDRSNVPGQAAPSNHRTQARRRARRWVV